AARGIDVAAARAEAARAGTIPFEPERKYMATLHREGAGRRLLVKGAPDRVLGWCAMTPAERVEAEAAMDALARRGMRLLATAERRIADGDGLPPPDAPGELRLLGITGISDPPREDAVEAVAACTRAGIRVK